MTEEIEEARRLVAYDWVVSSSWNRLHHVYLTDEQLADMYEYRRIGGPLRLACGRTAKSISIPGVFTRMGAPRCARCCDACCYPHGTGSPKNDPACRRLLGLPVEATDD